MWKAFKSLFFQEKANFQVYDGLQMKTDVAAAKLNATPKVATCTLYKKTPFQEENLECAKNPKELLDDDEWIKFLMCQRVSSKPEEQDIYKTVHQDCSNLLNQVEALETYKWNDVGYLPRNSQNIMIEKDSSCPEEQKFDDAVEHLVEGFEDPTSNHIFPDFTDDSRDEPTTPGADNTLAEVSSLPMLPSMPDLNEGSNPVQLLDQDKVESFEDVKSQDTVKNETEKTKSSSSTSLELFKTTTPSKSDFNEEKNALTVLNQGKMESIQSAESSNKQGELVKTESSSTSPVLLKSTPKEVKSIKRNVIVMAEGDASVETENSLSDSKETIVNVPSSNKNNMINLVFLNESNQSENDTNSTYKTLTIPQENVINIKLHISPLPETSIVKPKVSTPRTKKKLLDLTSQPMLTVENNNTAPKKKRSVLQDTPSSGNSSKPLISQMTALISDLRMPLKKENAIASSDLRIPSTSQGAVSSSDWRMPSTKQGTVSCSNWRYPLSSHVDDSYSLSPQVNSAHHGNFCHQDSCHNPGILQASQPASKRNSEYVTVECVGETLPTVHGMDLTKTPQKKSNFPGYFYTVRPVSPLDVGAVSKTMNKKFVLLKNKDQPSAGQVSGITHFPHHSNKLERNCNQENPITQNSTVKVKEGSVNSNTFNNLENASAADFGKLLLEMLKKEIASSDATTNVSTVDNLERCGASSLVGEKSSPGKLLKDDSTTLNLGKLIHEFKQKQMNEASKVKKAQSYLINSSSSKKRKNTCSSREEPCLKKSNNTKCPSGRETSKLELTPRSLRKRKIESYKV